MTDKAELEQLYLNTYLDRLTPNPINEDLKDLFELKGYFIWNEDWRVKTESYRWLDYGGPRECFENPEEKQG